MQGKSFKEKFKSVGRNLLGSTSMLVVILGVASWAGYFLNGPSGALAGAATGLAAFFALYSLLFAFSLVWGLPAYLRKRKVSS